MSENIRNAMGPLAEPTNEGNVTQTLNFAVMILSNGCLNKLSYGIRMVFALERGAVLVGVVASSEFASPGPAQEEMQAHVGADARLSRAVIRRCWHRLGWRRDSLRFMKGKTFPSIDGALSRG